MHATALRPAKPAKPVTIKPIDVKAGSYAVLSSDKTSWYVADVAANTCGCPAGVNGFRNCAKQGGMCRHLHAAHALAAVIRSRRLAAQKPVPADAIMPAPITKTMPTMNAMQTCSHCGTQYWGRPAAHWCSCERSKPAEREPLVLDDYRRGAADLLDAFGREG